MSQLETILKYFADFTPKQLEQLTTLELLYKEWNEKINVISRKDIDSLYEKHILHSLSIAAITNLPDGAEIIDIGTGGGFPGIPLAIFFPEVKFHLVDSIGKKLKVVEAVAEGTGLQNVTTQHTRAEEIKNRQFDYVVSRAVTQLKELWRWSKPLIKKNRLKTGSEDTMQDQMPTLASGLICLKGGDLHQEISDSGTRPRILEISDLFNEPFFKEKFVIYVPA